MGGARRFALVIALAVAGLVTQAAAQAPADEPFQIASAELASVAAPALPDARMTVAVTIAGTGPYPFIIDTAAERSVIARELARQLALPPAGRARLLSMTSTRTIDQVRMRDVSFLPGTTRDLNAFTLRGENIGAAGVLGIDALRGQRVVLDFRAETMSVDPSPRRAPSEPDAIVVRARQRYGQLVLTESSIDGVDIDVVIDSGLEVSMGNEALRRLLRTRTDRSTFQPITLHSITGEDLPADYAIVSDFRIASIRISNMPVAFADAWVFQRLGARRRPVLFLGMETLRHFDRVTVDFANRRAAFVMPESARPEQ